MPKSFKQTVASIAFITSPITLTGLGIWGGVALFGGIAAPVVGGLVGALAGLSFVSSQLSGIGGGAERTFFEAAADLSSRPFKFVGKSLKNAFAPKAKRADKASQAPAQKQEPKAPQP